MSQNQGCHHILRVSGLSTSCQKTKSQKPTVSIQEVFRTRLHLGCFMCEAQAKQLQPRERSNKKTCSIIFWCMPQSKFSQAFQLSLHQNTLAWIIIKISLPQKTTSNFASWNIAMKSCPQPLCIIFQSSHVFCRDFQTQPLLHQVHQGIQAHLKNLDQKRSMLGEQPTNQPPCYKKTVNESMNLND